MGQRNQAERLTDESSGMENEGGRTSVAWKSRSNEVNKLAEIAQIPHLGTPVSVSVCLHCPWPENINYKTEGKKIKVEN